MKYAKTLGLAAAAAMVLMALAGASAASATVLCKTNPGNHICAEADHYSKVVIDGSIAGSALLETTGGTPINTCKTGTLKMRQINTGKAEEAVYLEVQTLSWGAVPECTHTMDTIANGVIPIVWNEGTHNGTVWSEKTKVTATSLLGSCIYWTGEEGAEPKHTNLGTIKGGKESTIEINTILTKFEEGSAAACPKEARWTATYKITEPEDPMYIENE